MALEKWRPFGDFLTLHDRINRLFQDEIERNYDRGSEAPMAWYPVTDIYETKDDYVFKLEVPGMSKEDINIEFKDDTLLIKGEKREEKEIKRENYHRIESQFGSFARSFRLPRDIDHKKINAEMKEGILILKIGKVEEKKPKSIPINIK